MRPKSNLKQLEMLKKRKSNIQQQPQQQVQKTTVNSIADREEMSKKAFNQAEDILERIRTRSELRKSKHKSNQQKLNEMEKESDNGSMADTENQQG